MSIQHTHPALFFASLAVSLAGCGAGAGTTVPGPESTKLLPATDGYIIMTQSRGGMTAIRLPDLRETTLRPAAPSKQERFSTVHAMSGPDRQGRIAYIEDHMFGVAEKDERHLLKTINADGTQDTEIFARAGNASWATTAAGKGEIGECLALSPVLGRVAFLSETKSAQMPGMLLHTGTLEIWDVEKKTGSRRAVKVLDDGLAWFPDGNRIAYAKLVEPKAEPPSPETEAFMNEFKEWDKLPVVFILDLETGKESLLHRGWRPVVSPDGKSVLLTDVRGSWKRVDVATGKATPLTWQGGTQWYLGVIANPAQDVVLSWCYPTEGQPVKQTEHNSPLRGPKQMLSLKLAKLDSAEFQTVVPHIDPRTRVSYGQMSPKQTK